MAASPLLEMESAKRDEELAAQHPGAAVAPIDRFPVFALLEPRHGRIDRDHCVEVAASHRPHLDRLGRFRRDLSRLPTDRLAWSGALPTQMLIHIKFNSRIPVPE